MRLYWWDKSDALLSFFCHCMLSGATDGVVEGLMDKSIVSLKHCVISLFVVPLAIDLVYQPALLKGPTIQSKDFDTMALVVPNPPGSLRCLSPASMETIYPVRNKIFACSVSQTPSQIHTQQIQLTHTRDVVSCNNIQRQRAPSHL